MSPSLMEGDVVAWTPTNMDDVEVGDVVVFKSYVSWPGEKIVVHRVSKILREDGTGNIILETKGDANSWTDQAGPHIPEPYIRESHLMGKVISIGQQPLKIPFVGYIGVWINQGMDLISQPTSQRDSLSYIGIFAPLTISVVVLVVLMFLLPEKANTFKEKIRLYIFGHKPINLKKTFVFFIVAYIVFLSIIHCFAYDSQTTSVGIETNSVDTQMNFGRIGAGTESNKKSLQLLNPSTMPVKGVVFGRGDVSDFVSKKVFQLEKGEISSIKVSAKAPNGTAPAVYQGKIMIYSSPFWLIFPDDFVQNMVNLNSESTVFILDSLSALILTSLTMSLLVGITFIGDKTAILLLDRSWKHSSKLIIKRATTNKVSSFRRKIGHAMSKKMWWVLREDLSSKIKDGKIVNKIGKPIIASLSIIPLVFLITDQIFAMIIAVILAGILAYLISCKLRKKIILTTFFAIIIVITHMIIQSNLIILSTERTMMEILALTFGAIGIYLLILSLFLIPLALVAWAIAHLIRNVKEQKDPLLSLEGSCDL